MSFNSSGLNSFHEGLGFTLMGVIVTDCYLCSVSVATNSVIFIMDRDVHHLRVLTVL